MSAKTAGTPRDHGYRMPAEWAEHDATWIAWPHNPTDWPGKFQPISWVYADIVRHLASVETVQILIDNAMAQERAQKILRRVGADLARVRFHRWPTDRVWTRDSGPIFVKNGVGEVAITNWRFNAWAKYDDWKLDDQIPGRVARLLKLPEWTPQFNGRRVVLEGGSIDTNGAGTLLTTKECLLSEVQQRNPGMGRADLEQVFHDFLGMEQVIWLNRGIAGDDTHGHVDDITRFVSENVIVTVTEPNRADENYLPLAENLERLRSARNLKGRPFKVVELPMPAPVIFEGQRLPASYGNFYIANGLVLAPTFNDPNDRIALNMLAELFPRRRVVGIHCGDFIWGLGAMHCMTQQQPL
ncbi:MAG TPA: agmatine deiminase family protein [Acidobacteriaceae bacterium]|nr:agmatine deiminase family protein [Acidobacteriaceae bacterium]